MDKELAIRIKALIQGVKDVSALANEVERLGVEGRKPIPDATRNLREGAKQTRSAIKDLSNELLAFVSAGAILRFVKETVREFATAESAFKGLESVANASGYGVGNALKAAENLAADGLISVAEAAKSLQNLLSRGYSLDQAFSTLERLKDSAAFNRVAHLSLGEAVVTATEGLRNENSILVDNAGVTKNVAKMWEDYAKQLGVTTESLSQQQKIEAEYQGIMQETQAQLGNSEKALAGYQGQMAQADQETLKFKQSLGELLVPATLALAKAGTFLIENLLKPMVFWFQTAGVNVGQLASAIGRYFKFLTDLDFTALRDGLAEDARVADELLQEYAGNLNDKSLEITKSLSGGEDAQKIMDNANKRAQANGAEQKKLIQERIKDYERLKDAIQKAWEDSIEAEKNYLAEAKKLRAEANAFNPQSLAGASPQEIATKEISLRGDLRIAQERLQRLVSEGGNVEQIRQQAEAVQELADQYRSLTENVESDADKAEISIRADDAIKQSKLSLAKALEQAAADERLRQKDQIKALADVEKTLADLEKPKTITVNNDQALKALQDVKVGQDAIQDKTVTVTVKTLRIDAANAENFTGVTDSQGNPVYREPLQRASGGPVVGSGPKGVDSVLGLFAPNEHVWTSDETDAVGGHAAQYRLRAMARAGILKQLLSGIGGFAVGGAINASLATRSAAARMSMPAMQISKGSASDGLDRGTFQLPGGDSHTVYGAPSFFNSLVSLSLQHRKRN